MSEQMNERTYEWMSRWQSKNYRIYTTCGYFWDIKKVISNNKRDH